MTDIEAILDFSHSKNLATMTAKHLDDFAWPANSVEVKNPHNNILQAGSQTRHMIQRLINVIHFA